MKITKLALNDILYELVSDITIDNTLTTNQDSVPSTALVKTNIDRIDNSVSEVNTQLSTIQSNLSSLQTSVSELNAKLNFVYPVATLFCSADTDQHSINIQIITRNGVNFSLLFTTSGIQYGYNDSEGWHSLWDK